MAVLEIKKLNDPVLRRKCAPVKKVDKEIRKIIVDMAQTMKESQGIGLSASQVGISKRLIVVQSDLKSGRILGLINPEIKKKSKEKETDKEGCLSFPGIFLEIKRAKEILIEAQDFNGKKIQLKASNLFARVFQHEIDHLNGILFFNRLSFVRKVGFKMKYPKIKM